MTQMPWPKAPAFPPGRYCEVQVDENTRAYGHFKDIPDGFLVRLLRPTITSYGRTRFYRDSGPGFYPNTCYLIAELPDGSEMTFCSNYLKGDKSYGHRDFKVADLPETEYWEGDEVYFKHLTKGLQAGTISKVDYDEGKDGNVKVTYGFSYEDYGGWSRQGAASFSLQKRGQLYDYKNHGIKPHFDAVEDEAAFYLTQREGREVLNPDASPNLPRLWSYVEFLNALVEGRVDMLSVSNGLFGSGGPPKNPFERTVYHTPYSFQDREVGERIRAAALEGFKHDIARFVPAPRPSIPSQYIERMAKKLEEAGNTEMAARIRQDLT